MTARRTALLLLVVPPTLSAAPRVQDVVAPDPSGVALQARVYAPPAESPGAPWPAISVLPGGGAGISSVEWAALALADAGYVVIVTKPQFGGSTASYNTAARAGIDFLLSNANPFRAETNTERVGAAGWSLGARALARTQEEDHRIDAIVGWDNIAISESGDAGSPACTNTPSTIRTPRVPAMGQASDFCTNGVDSKKTAFLHWRAAGVPAMQVVFRGADHFLWSAGATPDQHALSSYYTVAWFDRWLKDSQDAAARLLDCSPPVGPLADRLSITFRSGAFFDGVDTADLRAACAPPPACQGDLNADGVVNTADLLAFLPLFGTTAATSPADLNNDGAVNTLDLSVFLGLFGRTCH